MHKRYIKTINVEDKNSLNEIIWLNNNEVYKAQYRYLNKSHADILGYHFVKYPYAQVDIFEFLKKEKNIIINMCYSYSKEDKANINSISKLYFLENDLIDEMLIKEEWLNVETSELGTIQKFIYNTDGNMIYLLEYLSNGKLIHIINFLDNEDNINDFDNPLERIDWSQVICLKKPTEYYSDGLI